MSKNTVQAIIDYIESNIEEELTMAITITDPFVDPFDRIPNGWKNVWAQAEKDYEIRQDFPSCGFEEVYETIEGTFMNIYVPIK